MLLASGIGSVGSEVRLHIELRKHDEQREIHHKAHHADADVPPTALLHQHRQQPFLPFDLDEEAREIVRVADYATTELEQL